MALGDSLTTTSPETPLIEEQPTQNVQVSPQFGTQAPGLLNKVEGLAKAPGHYVGEAFGKALSGLGGSHNEYSIDPNTGATVATPVKSNPTDTFRSILALGLMGSQGIGPKSGDHTFTQGLLSGLGSGANQAVTHNEQQDTQRRAQAQQEYANQLKAAEDQREQKKLSIDEQLNQVTIADHWQQMAARKITMDKAAIDLADAQQKPVADALLANANMRIQADKPFADGMKEIGVAPIAENITMDSPEAQKFLNQGHQWLTGYIAKQTGVRTVVDPQTREVHMEDTYTIFPASLSSVKVPPSLLSEVSKAASSDPHMKPLLSALTAKGEDGTISTRSLMDVYRQLTSWENIQKQGQDWEVKKSEILRNNSEAAEAGVRANALRYDLKNKEEVSTAENLFGQLYNPVTHQQIPEAQNYFDPKGIDPKTNKPWNPAQVQQHQKESQLLKKYGTALYDQAQQKLADISKVTKNAQGDIETVDTPAIAAQTQQVAGYARFVDGLQTGFKNPSGSIPSDITDPRILQTIQLYKTQGTADSSVIQKELADQNVPQQAIDQVIRGLNLSPPSPLATVPEGYTLVKNNSGSTLVPNDTVDAFVAKHPDFQKVGQGQQKKSPEGQPFGTFQGEGGTTLTR